MTGPLMTLLAVRRKLVSGVSICGLSCCCLAGALAQSPDIDLSDTSLENLTQMQVSVSSFARKDEDLWKTPAAVFVITREDIDRSAATSIPELLRMVPGMQVAQLNASSWAVSARGFNGAYSYKLLVLIDGRTVYSEIYSGAHWDQTDLPLETIERIEVIRGPGAAVWGTNAVNGVINIITRRARATTGIVASGGIGRINDATTLQYGGSVGDRLQFRGYANYTNRRPFETSTGKEAFDGEDSARGGARIDWQRTHADWFTLSGDIYGGHLKQQLRPSFALPVGPNGQDSGWIAGGYLLGRWEHKLEHSDTALQAYFDDSSRHELTSYPTTRTLDAEFQDHLSIGPRNDLVWGGELRLTWNHIGGDPPLIKEREYNNYLVDGFAQDEFTLVPNRLVITVGSKIQQGTLAGTQVQPSVRVLWSPNARQSAWAAISRAVVAPSIQDKAVQFPLALGTQGGLPIVGILRGDPDYRPETVLAYEAGYRRRIGGTLTLDVAGFFDIYHLIQSLEVASPVFVPTPPPHVEIDLRYANGYRARTGGVEAALSWKPLATLSFHAGYAWAEAHIRQSVAGNQSLADSWGSPLNTFTASGAWSFAPKWGLNAFLYHVDALPKDLSLSANVASSSVAPNATPVAPAQVAGFNRLDLHVTRKLGRSFEFDAGGTNLLTPRHVEFVSGTGAITPAYIPRSLFLDVKWTF